MNDLKKRTPNGSNISRLLCLSALLLCVCTEIPEHCGNYRLFLNGQCAEDPNAPKIYTVAISSAGAGATSGGNYEAGVTVDIYAGEAPAGQQFKNWTGNVTFANAGNQWTTFVMPSNAVTVTANFEADSTPVTKYQVTVSSAGTGSTGSGGYAAGATVEIYAGTAPSGQQFKNWTGGVTFNNASNARTTFTMPSSAVTVTANFEASSTPAIKYQVTVSSNGTGATGGGSYAAGEKVTIYAGTAPSGYQFKNWTSSSGVSFANSSSANTTFTMPSNAVTVTANFELKSIDYVTIGGIKWMKKNLDIEKANSWCYDDKPANCTTYGRLYTWDVARIACPAGWHLPTDQEWTKLVTTAGGSEEAGYALKSKTGWNRANGTDSYGFSALPGGYRTAGGKFYSIGDDGFWWTASESGGQGRRRYMTSTSGDYYYGGGVYDATYGVFEGEAPKNTGYSVRCAAD